MLFMSQSRLHLIVSEPVIYLAGLLDFTDLSVYFVAVIQCPLAGDGLIHSVLFACFFLISKQLQTLLICLSHMLSRGFGHSSVMSCDAVCCAQLTLCCPRWIKCNRDIFLFPSYFTNSTINFCMYIPAVSLPTAEAEAACQPCGSEEGCELF